MTVFRTRPGLKENNVDLSFYEPLYTSIVLANNNYIIQGEHAGRWDLVIDLAGAYAGSGGWIVIVERGDALAQGV